MSPTISVVMPVRPVGKLSTNDASEYPPTTTKPAMNSHTPANCSLTNASVAPVRLMIANVRIPAKRSGLSRSRSRPIRNPRNNDRPNRANRISKGGILIAYSPCDVQNIHAVRYSANNNTGSANRPEARE